MPVMPLGEQLGGVSSVAGEPEGFGQGDKVLMAVQFPGDFAVAHLVEIEILYTEP